MWLRIVLRRGYKSDVFMYGGLLELHCISSRLKRSELQWKGFLQRRGLFGIDCFIQGFCSATAGLRELQNQVRHFEDCICGQRKTNIHNRLPSKS